MMKHRTFIFTSLILTGRLCNRHFSQTPQAAGISSLTALLSMKKTVADIF
jgi:hypothetical protein